MWVRSEYLRAITLTILFGMIYVFVDYQSRIFGRTLFIIENEALIAIYSFLLAYIILGIYRYTYPIKPFALSIALYLILKVITLSLARFSIFAIVYTFVNSMDTYFLLFFIGFALARVELPLENTRFERYLKIIQPVISATGLLIMGYMGFLIISNLPFDPDKTQKIAYGFFMFLLILAATSLANLSDSGAARWLRDSRTFLLIFLVVVSTYYVFLRPLILKRMGLVNFVEWALVVMLLLKFSTDFRRSLVVEEKEAVGVHRQRLSYKKDEIIQALDSARRLFVEEGKKSPLVAALSRILFDAGWSEERVARLISPLVSYSDEKIPKFAFNWEIRIIKSRNRKRRLNVVKEIEEIIRKEGVEIGSKNV